VIPQSTINNEHVVNLIFHAVVTEGELQTRNSVQLDERNDHAEYLPVGSLSILRLFPPVTEEIAEAFLEDFHGETKYLGNVWEETKTID
jgi:hypothetical protein